MRAYGSVARQVVVSQRPERASYLWVRQTSTTPSTQSACSRPKSVQAANQCHTKHVIHYSVREISRLGYRNYPFPRLQDVCNNQIHIFQCDFGLGGCPDRLGHLPLPVGGGPRHLGVPDSTVDGDAFHRRGVQLPR